MCGQLLTGTVSLQSLREQMVTKCVNTLFSYRKFCATTSSSGQLILPEALKLLPLYTLAAQKGTLMRSEIPAVRCIPLYLICIPLCLICIPLYVICIPLYLICIPSSSCRSTP